MNDSIQQLIAKLDKRNQKTDDIITISPADQRAYKKILDVIINRATFLKRHNLRQFEVYEDEIDKALDRGAELWKKYF